MDTASKATKIKGLAAPTTNPQTTTKPKLNFTDNSTNNQQAKLLGYLKEHGSITTAQARELLDVMSPAARIMELKETGYLIVMSWDNWTSEHNIKHRLARYILTQLQDI